MNEPLGRAWEKLNDRKRAIGVENDTVDDATFAAYYSGFDLTPADVDAISDAVNFAAAEALAAGGPLPSFLLGLWLDAFMVGCFYERETRPPAPPVGWGVER